MPRGLLSSKPPISRSTRSDSTSKVYCSLGSTVLGLGYCITVEKRELEPDTIMDTVVMPQAKRLKLDTNDEELEDIDGRPLAVFQDGVREGDEEKISAALSHVSTA